MLSSSLISVIVIVPSDKEPKVSVPDTVEFPEILPLRSPTKLLAVIVPVAVKSPALFKLIPVSVPKPSEITCKLADNPSLSPTFSSES